MKTFRQSTLILIAGDVLAILIVTIIGFMTHNELINGRLFTTFLPYLVAWFSFAPWLGVYQREQAYRPNQVWRAMLAAFLAAPMAAWLRAAWLGSAILPIFVLALGSSSALGFGVWRLIWVFAAKRAGWNGRG